MRISIHYEFNLNCVESGAKQKKMKKNVTLGLWQWTVFPFWVEPIYSINNHSFCTHRALPANYFGVRYKCTLVPQPVLSPTSSHFPCNGDHCLFSLFPLQLKSITSIVCFDLAVSEWNLKCEVRTLFCWKLDTVITIAAAYFCSLLTKSPSVSDFQYSTFHFQWMLKSTESSTNVFSFSYWFRRSTQKLSLDIYRNRNR